MASPSPDGAEQNVALGVADQLGDLGRAPTLLEAAGMLVVIVGGVTGGRSAPQPAPAPASPRLR